MDGTYNLSLRLWRQYYLEDIEELLHIIKKTTYLSGLYALEKFNIYWVMVSKTLYPVITVQQGFYVRSQYLDVGLASWMYFYATSGILSVQVSIF